MKRIVLFIVIILLIASAGISSGAFPISWQDVNNYFSRFQPEKTSETGVKIGEDTVRLIDEESAVIEVIEKVSPSVVTVGVVRQSPVIEFDPSDPFGFFSQPRQQGSKTEEADIGSGFIISENGLIVTNKHVVNDSGEYKVITSDEKTYDVKNIYRDPANDLAILQIEASGLQPVTLGNSDNLKVGQTVIALGTPLGEFRGTATKGILSGLGRGITTGSPFDQGMAEELDDVIQTDAAINPGNSGGPLLNTSAQVIGVNTAMASGAENIGFALPINLVKEAVDNFEKTGSFDRAFLGVSYRIVTRELSVMNDIPEGAYVLEVVEGSAAEKAGIHKGDIITKFDGQRVRDGEGESLAERINQKRKGDSASVTVWREGKETDLTVSLGEFDGR